jgi:hypothetical protein
MSQFQEGNVNLDFSELDQWKPWKGETIVPPVPGQWLVEVRSNSGRYAAGKAGGFLWRKGSADTYIVEYRVIRRTHEGGVMPTSDGWVSWKGGPSPHTPNTMVEVKYRDGAGRKDFAGKFRWGWAGNCADAVRDIVSYRVSIERTPMREVGVTQSRGERINRGLVLIESARALVNEARQIEGPGGKMSDIWVVSRPALRGLIDALMAVEKEVF